ncbi:methyltransferase regulatory domain-containing protein [Azospirillum doebereinerae]|uniref:methyltransferase regulatory domain-containing protein n=1 Tax=Azospirillum doebereinerae TaxID=92933 RepID=UPI001EE542D2|nr:methyltransferase regulatory domain-containing protein [Azospirillum doebereinerae]MCG5240219.1 methyltransferase regulatory domain-containing protein [Azospirillum doebereinerae]
MSDWSAGYVSDIEYLPGFYREQGPAHLTLSCLINGIAPPATANGFDYCELGCGHGTTVALFAAANPKGRFHAVDFHPAHIARARDAAAEAGLTNIAFHEASFADLADGTGPELPEFDFVTLHGVYSWVSPMNRGAIARFLSKKLKPGGIVYVSYNAQPGWTPMMPLQRLLYEYSGLVHERSDRQVKAGLDFAESLFKAGAKILGDEAMFAKLRGESKTQSATDQSVYLAHEYLNGSWHPLYHVDVARELGEAKLTYAGSATLFENYPELALTAEQRTALDGIGVPSLRETFKDYCVGRPFRRDVFVRGARRISVAKRDALLADMGMALIVPRADARTTIQVPLGEATLEAKHYEPIFDALAERPRRIGELMELPEVRRAGGKLSAVEIAGMLTGSAQALPVLEPADRVTPLPSVLAHNRSAAAELATSEGRKSSAFAASVGGAGLHVSVVEALLYDGLCEGVPEQVDALVVHAMKRLSAPENADDASRNAIAESMGWCLRNSLPVWRKLGVIG